MELEYTTFSIVEQLSRVISTQENQAILKDIEIVFEKPRKDITINGDEQRLEQVWINIISNAIKYTDNGGLITIKVKKTSKEVEVSIEDTGRGMSKEVISHIFDVDFLVSLRLLKYLQILELLLMVFETHEKYLK